MNLFVKIKSSSPNAKNPAEDDPKSTELYQIGVLATIDKLCPVIKGEINALVKGIEKVKVISFTKQDSWFEAKWKL